MSSMKLPTGRAVKLPCALPPSSPLATTTATSARIDPICFPTPPNDPTRSPTPQPLHLPFPYSDEYTEPHLRVRPLRVRGHSHFRTSTPPWASSAPTSHTDFPWVIVQRPGHRTGPNPRYDDHQDQYCDDHLDEELIHRMRFSYSIETIRKSPTKPCWRLGGGRTKGTCAT